MERLARSPNTAAIVDELLAVWPEHRSYCETRFREADEAFDARVDELSALALKNTGSSLRQYCEDYRWMCEEFLKEEIYFRREGSYRLSTFEDAYREVYSKPEYMGRYVRGILISQIIWEPHAKAFDFFRTNFLPALPQGGSYLEVGPGHGLFLYFASRSPNLATLEAWDVSQASIAETRQALSRLGATRDITIVEQDVLKAPARLAAFDGAVISEVLEHLERPDLALASLHAALRPGGRIFINAPINSPAPDHIYLWRTPDELIDMVRQVGFEPDEVRLLPVTGATLENAMRKDLSISVVIVASKCV